MTPTKIQSSLPRYKCHKEVRAVKIAAIEFAPLPEFKGALCRGSQAFGTACGQCERCKWYQAHPGPRNAVITPDITPEGFELPSFVVSGEFMSKHKPVAGGYFVVYEDGYESFSPAQAFEEGYTLIA
jgi:hypothetical protein